MPLKALRSAENNSTRSTTYPMTIYSAMGWLDVIENQELVKCSISCLT